jgi:hypothetical protein
MDNYRDSLDAQHRELEAYAQTVIAAGRAGRWGEYRMSFGALRDGLARHMAYEEEALFPVLAEIASATVAKLREDHDALRRRLEMVGAAAPEQDPEGCLAEIEGLVEAMQSHHADEMALDPQYALRGVPHLELGVPPMDLRGLQPPEPLVRIFSALEREPGTPLRVILPHEPVPLYNLLRERGYSYAGTPRSDGGFEVLIEKN